MRVDRTLLALSLIAAPTACAADGKPSPVAEPKPASAPAGADDPFASFARLVGGEWQLASGASHFHSWHWGPGRRSMRRMSHWPQPGANPWAGEVMYWHPGLRQVCLLSLHGDIPAVGRGVAEGTIRFDGETSFAAVELDQPRGRRTLGQRQSFDGRDKYRETLLEDSGAGLRPLNVLDFVRDERRPEAPSLVGEPAPIALPERWKPFEALLGSTWESRGDAARGSAGRIRSTFGWVPSLEVVFACATALRADGESAPLLEAYIFRSVRNDVLRCLALSDRGGVYEGDVTVREGGPLRLDLRAYEGDRLAPLVVRFDVESERSLRARVWSLDGGDRTLTLDVEQEKLEPKRD